MSPEKKPLGKPPSFVPSLSAKKKEEEEDRGGAMSLLSRQDAGVGPLPRRAAVGRAGLRRLLNLKPNEMAFVFTGLGILLLAPLIEYMVSRSPGESAMMHSAFNDSSTFLPETETPKDEGVLRMAAGNLVGQFDTLVKPLNAPDPTRLIDSRDMDVSKNPQAQAQPLLETSVTRKKPRESTNWEDALAVAARGSVSQASRSAGLPRPTAKVAGKLAGTLSGLQGLTALSGGGGSGAGSKALSLAAPTSQGLAGTLLQRNDSLPRSQSLPEFRGGRPRGPDASGGSPANFLNTAPNSFGRPPSGMTVDNPGSLQPQVGPTQSPGGRPGEGDAIKNPGINSTKETRDMKAQKSLQQDMAEYNAKKQADLNWAIQQNHAIDEPKMVLQQELQTAGQLANTGVQGAFDLLKTAINPNAQNQNRNQNQGSGSGAGSPGSGSGPGSFGQALNNLQTADRQVGGISDAIANADAADTEAKRVLASGVEMGANLQEGPFADLANAQRNLELVRANRNSTAADINQAAQQVHDAAAVADRSTE